MSRASDIIIMEAVPSRHVKEYEQEAEKVLTRIIIAFCPFLVLLRFLPVDGYLRMALYMVPYLVIGYDILKKAFKGIRNRQVFDENLSDGSCHNWCHCSRRLSGKALRLCCFTRSENFSRVMPLERAEEISAS